jgi:hypothetical protein
VLPRPERRAWAVIEVSALHRVMVIVALIVSMLFLPSSAAASVWDADDVDGPLDIRSVNVVPLRHDRLNLTISFWAPFHRSAIGHRFGEGVWVGFDMHTFDFVTNAYVLRRSGSIVLVHGDFGSSACCYRSRITWLSRRTLTTNFLPWWIRTGEDVSHGMPYQARSRVCRDPCIRDHTRWGVIP